VNNKHERKKEREGGEGGEREGGEKVEKKSKSGKKKLPGALWWHKRRGVKKKNGAGKFSLLPPSSPCGPVRWAVSPAAHCCAGVAGVLDDEQGQAQAVTLLVC
jgi:hypothetical protein